MNGQINHNDPRIQKILDLILQFNLGNFSKREHYSEKGDAIDAIIVGLNTLGEEMESSGKTIRNYEDRVNSIMETLLRYTVFDFSEPARLSGIGDELDAIVVGLNTLAEELVSARHVQQMQVQTLQKNEEKIRRLNSELSLKLQQLETSNAELEAFTYSVSHDLRAPLRAIHGYTKLLEEDYGAKLDGDALKMMQSVSANAKKMGQLIDDLLELSRLGRKELQKKEVDLTELAQAVAGEVKSAYKQVNVKITVHELGKALADASLMHQVFYNLIANAVKYSSTKEQALVEVGKYEKEEQVVYYIKDNGVGFNMKYYDKLFGVFQRLHSSNEFEGTGVGLALVKRIISKHEGTVWAEGEQDKGATFYFTLNQNNQQHTL